MKILSRYLSFILRHKPEAAGITLDEYGWADVRKLLGALGKTQNISMEQLEETVLADAKRRFSFNEDRSLIHANYGHSVRIDAELPQAAPPKVLFHGTAEKSRSVIEREGLKPMSRLYVHLSADFKTAKEVGRRHGNRCVYAVNAGKMAADGYQFFLSESGVWLTKSVPLQYLKRWNPCKSDKTKSIESEAGNVSEEFKKQVADSIKKYHKNMVSLKDK